MSAASAASSLRIIVGPTAAGKSALALALAASCRGAIVSADSRQIYRGFDIGTAKPAPGLRGGVLHFGLDVAAPTERWSAARFAVAAAEWIRSAGQGQRTPVVVGGTGFWVSALVAPLAPIPPVDSARRDALDLELSSRTDPELRAWCVALDPAIATKGPAQWRRAILVALLTGRRLSDWHREAPALAPRRVRYLLVDPGPALEARIEKRVDEMFNAGWLDEVRSLAKTVPHSAIAWKACGYERLRDALESGTSLVQVRKDVIAETRQYARRQRTWFRRQLKHGPVTPIDPEMADAVQRARAWWNGGGIE